MTDLDWSTPALAKARDALRSTFGYADFRAGQGDVVAAVLARRNVFAVMPTGSGKSICYQLPALVEDGFTVVVSPLLALMRDQVRQMRAVGIEAATLNSESTDEETQAIFAGLRNRTIKLLFLSPERFAKDGLADRLRQFGAARLAVDEAHCVSQWGHDFRPEYRDLKRHHANLGAPPLLALTATADENTREDIIRQLFPARPELFVHGFDRPNIALRFEAKDKPRNQVLAFLKTRKGQSGIVYCASRKGTERIAEWLVAAGFDAIAYHAGFDQRERRDKEDSFQLRDGMIICATIAFGMGVNKPDVRFVIHADLPGTIEAYYQEIGRAGRDGLPAATLTLFGMEDFAFRRRQIADKAMPEEQKRIEHRKLDAMIALAESATCRRAVLLGYFGDTLAACQGCDLCAGSGVHSVFDGVIDAQKVLSAILRSGEMFGAAHIADILIGKRTEKILAKGHDTIKTFGAGADRSLRTWMSIIRQLFARGALEHKDEFGGLAVSEKGLLLLKGDQPVTLRIDPEPARTTRSTRRERETTLDTDMDATFKRLRALRLDLARQEGVAAYMIFGDRTLIEMAEKKPQTIDALAEIYGVGERKRAAYGDAFLEALWAE